MGFYSTQMWQNGAIISVERTDTDEVSIRVQAPNEGEMLVDMVIGDFEAMCLVSSIMSVLTKLDDTEFDFANIRKKVR